MSIWRENISGGAGATRAPCNAASIIASDGWKVHGKTGSGWLRDQKGDIVRNRPLGWFIGWAEKDGHRIVFARMRIGTKKATEPLGLALRKQFLEALPGLMQ